MFNIGEELKRSTIHDKYGGSRQSGICPCANFPYIFIFSGESGELYGYHDEWLTDDLFQYTGEGKLGNMSFYRGNLALRDHLKNGKRVFLFKSTKKSFVKFEAELQLFDIDFFDGLDENGVLRVAIKFFFKRVVANRVEEYLEQYPKFDIEVPKELQIKNTDSSTVVKSRIGQGAYRKSILYRWGNRCAVTGFYGESKVLVASHIVPWREATDKERLDVNNGILLSPLYDSLFDKHLISFGDEGEILLSNKLKSTPYSKLNIDGKEKIIGFKEENMEYLKRHRQSASL